MADVKWIKITTDIFDDEKILMIESLPAADTIIVIWFKLLALAGKSNNNGVFMLNNRIPYTEDMLAAIFRRDNKIVNIALDTFEQFGMIEIVNDVITIPNWDKHQTLDAYEKKKARDRELQAERRARQKALIGKSSDNRLTSDDGQMTVAVSEEEKEEEKEKDIHSFFHSAKNDEKMDVENYVERKVLGSGFEGKDAELYREELKEGIRLKYMGGTLGQGVILMSDEQFSDLCDKLSLDEIEKYFEIVVDCERKGKRYKRKSHYQAILDMAMKDRRIK
jgi:predicted phage replisome organizer